MFALAAVLGVCGIVGMLFLWAGEKPRGYRDTP